MKNLEVISKRPGHMPTNLQIRDTLEAMQQIVGDGRYAMIEQAITHKIDGLLSIAYCDEEYLLKEPRPAFNVRRPDGHPICGTLLVSGVNGGGETRSLTPREIAFWRAALQIMSPEARTWAESPTSRAHFDANLNAVDARDWDAVERCALFSTFDGDTRGSRKSSEATP